ncbi:MAG TPA: glycosyltransferase family 9 protein [Burkholderiales bacterium]|nr:glycosyltransferase family 9 protein [Burkholderiales bacterium]
MNAPEPKPRALAFEKPPSRVLLIVTRRIGDVLLATPVLRSIKNAWPQARIDVLVFTGTEGFLMGNPDVHRVLTVPERPRLAQHARLLAALARHYDLALSLLPGDRPTLYAWIAARSRAGLLEENRKSLWKRALLDAWVPFDNVDTHTVRMHLALLGAVGIEPAPGVIASWTPEDEKLVETLLAPLEHAPYAVIHPYPKFRYKMWTVEGWITLARALAERGLAVVLTGGPGADERAYVERIARNVPDALDLSGRLSLGGTALAVSKAMVYVGPDTAITHAAAALGVPTVALYGPTNPVKWGPWPAGQPAHANPWARTGTQAAGHVRLVQGVGPCVPCGFEGCERHVESTSDCLIGLPASRVIDAVEDLIG